jgi:ribulose-phosphate 3-epimerase
MERPAHAMPTVIAPSILSADFARLGEEVDAVLAAGADWVHFDVMDNHYVPNLTIGPLVCEALRKHGVTAPIDVHLMVKPVDRIVPDFAKAGASLISFHPEASAHVHRTMQLIRRTAARPAWCSTRPRRCPGSTRARRLDLVLLMSVNPGFGGQPSSRRAGQAAPGARAIDAQRPGDPAGDRRRRQGRQHRRDRRRRADTFVAGSAIFNAPDYADVIGRMPQRAL